MGDGGFAVLPLLVSVGIWVVPRAMLEVWSGRKNAVSVRWVRWTASPSQCVLIWGAERVGGVSECEGYVE